MPRGQMAAGLEALLKDVFLGEVKDTAGFVAQPAFECDDEAFWQPTPPGMVREITKAHLVELFAQRPDGTPGWQAVFRVTAWHDIPRDIPKDTTVPT